ncbi:MAG: hypothetical protein RLY16_518 [Bacteroidota bacterium]
MDKHRWKLYFIVIGLLAIYTFNMHASEGFAVMMVMLVAGVLFRVINYKPHQENVFEEEDETEQALWQQHETQTTIPHLPLVYRGIDLEISTNDLIDILEKRQPYYNKLNPKLQERFIKRLQIFLAEKTFYIHDESGFKEMPVLISASAIQLSFGLENFELTHYPHLHIYPEAFIHLHPHIRLLEGNVSGNRVNLSWKHFLHGFQYPEDGQNVGLHEFAHAYYYQHFETEHEVEDAFDKHFPAFNNFTVYAMEFEKKPGNELYTDYGLSHWQEFWAESVEIFFEKPHQLKSIHPKLYENMCNILQQRPAENIFTVL